MGWCPNCKYEYTAGITNCKKCGALLVDDLSKVSRESSFEGSTTEAIEEKKEDSSYESFPEYSYSGNETFTPEENNLPELGYVTKPANAQNASSNDHGQIRRVVNTKTYASQKAKADDLLGAAGAFVTVGTLSLILVVLGASGILPFKLTTYGKIVFAVGMGVFSLALYILAVLNFREGKRILGGVNKETDLAKEISSWYKANLTAETIDENLFTGQYSDLTEEEKYFRRAAKISYLINQKFMNLDPQYLDRVVEDAYQYLYE